MRKWVLPEAIEDVLPAEAARVEALRRTLLDHFRARGYRLVQPPLVEFLDSLLTGTGPRPRPHHVQDRRSAVGPAARRARRHHAAGRAHRRAPAERSRASRACATRAACCARRRRRARRARSCRSAPSSTATPASRPTARSCSSSSSALGAAGVRGLHLDLGHVGLYRALARAAGLDGTGEGDDSRALRRAARQGRARRARAHGHAARARARRAARAARRSTVPPTRRSRRRATCCRRCPTSQARSTRWPSLAASAERRRRDPRRPRRPARLPLLHRRHVLGVRAGRAAAPSSIAAAAAATTAWAARSGARVPRPASRWTCAGSRRARNGDDGAAIIVAPADDDAELAQRDRRSCARRARR